MSRHQALEVLRRVRGEATADVLAALMSEAAPNEPHVTPRAAARILGRLVQAGLAVRYTRPDGLVVFRAR